MAVLDGDALAARAEELGCHSLSTTHSQSGNGSLGRHLAIGGFAPCLAHIGGSACRSVVCDRTVCASVSAFADACIDAARVAIASSTDRLHLACLDNEAHLGKMETSFREAIPKPGESLMQALRGRIGVASRSWFKRGITCIFDRHERWN